MSDLDSNLVAAGPGWDALIATLQAFAAALRPGAELGDAMRVRGGPDGRPHRHPAEERRAAAERLAARWGTGWRLSPALRRTVRQRAHALGVPPADVKHQALLTALFLGAPDNDARRVRLGAAWLARGRPVPTMRLLPREWLHALRSRVRRDALAWLRDEERRPAHVSLDAQPLAAPVAPDAPDLAPFFAAASPRTAELLRVLLQHAADEGPLNISAAARALGVSPKTAHAELARLRTKVARLAM